MYNEKTEKSLFGGTFAAKQQKVQHKILTSEYTYTTPPKIERKSRCAATTFWGQNA